MSLKKIKRAIISVADKSNLKIILPYLKKYNILLGYCYLTYTNYFYAQNSKNSVMIGMLSLL